jgi:hypothetical protein
VALLADKSCRAGFKRHLLMLVMSMVPIAVVTNLMKYGLQELALRFRSRLTRHLYSEYMRGFTYYKISNLDNRISNVDQLLAQDVDKFCQSATDLLQNVSKPLLDIIIYANKLSSAIGTARVEASCFFEIHLCVRVCRRDGTSVHARVSGCVRIGLDKSPQADLSIHCARASDGRGFPLCEFTPHYSC